MTITDAGPTTRLVNDELTSIASTLAARFPDLTPTVVAAEIRRTMPPMAERSW